MSEYIGNPRTAAEVARREPTHSERLEEMARFALANLGKHSPVEAWDWAEAWVSERRKRIYIAKCEADLKKEQAK